MLSFSFDETVLDTSVSKARLLCLAHHWLIDENVNSLSAEPTPLPMQWVEHQAQASFEKSRERTLPLVEGLGGPKTEGRHHVLNIAAGSTRKQSPTMANGPCRPTQRRLDPLFTRLQAQAARERGLLYMLPRTVG